MAFRARGLDFQALRVPPSSWGDAAAVAPTATDGSFVVFFPSVGFKYLDLPEASWRDGGRFSGSIDASLGIHCARDSRFVSFAETPPKSWACYQLLKDGKAPSAQLIERLCLPGEIRAVCDAGDDYAALALSSGQIRFANLSTGKSGKGLKLADSAKKSVALARLAPRRVLMVRESRGSIGPEFLIIELDDFNTVSLQRKGTLHMGLISMPLGQLESVAVANPEREHVLLCWRQKVAVNGSTPNGHSSAGTVRHFATAALSDKDCTLRLTPEPSSHGWHSVAGYYAEWRSQEDALAFHLRDARYGLMVASGQAPWSNDPSVPQPVSAQTAGSVTLVCAGSGFAAIKWLLSPFSLKGLVGRRCDAESRQVRRALDSGAAVLSRKRKREEENGNEQLTMKHLAELVRRCGALQKNNVSLLKACLKSEDMQHVTKVVLSWLRIHQGVPAAEIKKIAPTMPSQNSIMRFLKALADAFMPALVRDLTPDSLEAILERLVVAQGAARRGEMLYARARASCREKPRASEASEVKTKKNLEIERKLKAPKMEISVLKF